MRLRGLNSRQCRALLALRDRGPLSHEQLGAAIGPYATNTITSLSSKGFAVDNGAQLELTVAGRGLADSLAAQRPSGGGGRTTAAALALLLVLATGPASAQTSRMRLPIDTAIASRVAWICVADSTAAAAPGAPVTESCVEQPGRPDVMVFTIPAAGEYRVLLGRDGAVRSVRFVGTTRPPTQRLRLLDRRGGVLALHYVASTFPLSR